MAYPVATDLPQPPAYSKDPSLLEGEWSMFHEIFEKEINHFDYQNFGPYGVLSLI